MSFTGGVLLPKKTLYEDESGWGITEYKGYINAAMTHKCKTSNNNNKPYSHLTGNLSGKHRCSWCRAPAPDHIITLWTLLNFDRLAE